MAPPRRHRKHRTARVIGPRGPVEVQEPEPEPAPPPRRGLMASLMAPPRGGPTPMAPPTGPQAPPWTRQDYYAMAGVVAVVVVVIGLFLGLTSGNITTTVQKSPAPTTTTFDVAAGAPADFTPGQKITVGSVQATLKWVNGNQFTLESPLANPPKVGASVTQSLPLPFTTTITSEVASGATTTSLKLAAGYNSSFFAANENICVELVSGQCTEVSIKTVSGNNLTLASALPSAPAAGTTISWTVPIIGSLFIGILDLTVSELAIIVLPVAALVARPLAARFRRKLRPRVMETLFFGIVIWIVDTLVFELESATLQLSGLGAYLASVLVAVASGFVIAPFIYPWMSRMFRPRPRPTAAPSGRR